MVNKYIYTTNKMGHARQGWTKGHALLFVLYHHEKYVHWNQGGLKEIAGVAILCKRRRRQPSSQERIRLTACRQHKTSSIFLKRLTPVTRSVLLDRYLCPCVLLDETFLTMCMQRHGIGTWLVVIP